MSAPHLHDRLDAYVDGELDAGERQAADLHLAACAECRDDLAARREFDRRVAAHPVADPGARYWAEFAARVEARLPPPSEVPRPYDRLTGWLFPHGRFAWPRAAGAVVACTLVVYAGIRGFNPERAVLRPVGEISPRPQSPTAVAPRPAPQVALPPAPSVTAAPAPRIVPPAVVAPEPTGSAPNRFAKPAGGEAPKRLEKEVAGTAPTPTDRKMLDTGAAPPATARVDLQAAPSDGAPAPGFVAEPQVDRLAAKSSPVPPAADAVERFVAAAVAGDRGAAAAIAGTAAVAPEAHAEMQRWLALAAAPATSPGAPSGAPNAPVLLDAKPKPAASRAVERGRNEAASPSARSRDAWLVLDDLAWPERDRPAMRGALAAIAAGLLPHAADPSARERARAILEWLAVTSPTADETARWRAQLATLPAQ